MWQGSALHCDHELKEDGCELVDYLIDLEKNLSKETISSLLSIAGYVQKGTSEINDTTHYYENYSDFTNVLNWDSLTIPSNSCAQWIISCYILFTQCTDDFCRSFLTNQFESIAVKDTLQIQQKHGKNFANIFTKNHRFENSKKHKAMQPESIKIILKRHS